MSLNFYIDGVAVPADEIKFDLEPGTVSIGTTVIGSTTTSTTFTWADWIRPALSAEDYAIIEDVIIDSIVRGYMQDRRDVIDPA